MTPEELEEVQRLVDLAWEQVRAADDVAQRSDCLCWSCRWRRAVERAKTVLAGLR
jgi:hypothetical protein